MAAVDDNEARIVAVLHDVIEDSSVTTDDLRQQGFVETVLEALERLTHRKDEPNAEYVIRCKGHETARWVELADLVDNSRLPLQRQQAPTWGIGTAEPICPEWSP